MEVRARETKQKAPRSPHILARLLPAAVGRGGDAPPSFTPQQLDADWGCHLPGEQTPRLAESEQVLSSGNTADRFSFESKSQRQNGSQTCGWGSTPPPHLIQGGWVSPRTAPIYSPILTSHPQPLKTKLPGSYPMSQWEGAKLGGWCKRLSWVPAPDSTLRPLPLGSHGNGWVCLTASISR